MNSGSTSKDPNTSDYNTRMMDLMKDCVEIHTGKDEDYGEEAFVKAAQIASIIRGKKITAPDVAGCLIGLKAVRYGNLKDKKANFEKREDSATDLINYVALMIREEWRLEEATSKNEKRETTSSVELSKS